ncbi:MAG: DoxX family membrane protein [bacterium]|nr:DoxX family membrane protein [bacterium]
MKIKTWDNLFLIVRWLIAAIFIFAGITKILNPENFARDIDNYRMLPYLLVTIMAIILPWLEILCGIFLIIGKWEKGAAFMLLILTMMFLIAMSSAIFRGLDITCGCFAMTAEGTKVGMTRLIQDSILFGIILIINLREEK